MLSFIKTNGKGGFRLVVFSGFPLYNLTNGLTELRLARHTVLSINIGNSHFWKNQEASCLRIRWYQVHDVEWVATAHLFTVDILDLFWLNEEKRSRQVRIVDLLIFQRQPRSFWRTECEIKLRYSTEYNFAWLTHFQSTKPTQLLGKISHEKHYI